MVSINYSAREVCCKIVYYGPGLSGKTTNLQYVHEKVPSNTKGNLISLATEADRTLYFDFLPINIGTINGFQAKFQLYTVPGQVYYNATRKLVLRGVDGLVFVADSQPDKMDENAESLANLCDNLKEYGYDPAVIPIVMQYNKRDLPGVLSVEELNARLNTYNWPHFEASATVGNGVFDTLKMVIKIVLEKAKTASSSKLTSKSESSAEGNRPAMAGSSTGGTAVAEAPKVDTDEDFRPYPGGHTGGVPVQKAAPSNAVATATVAASSEAKTEGTVESNHDNEKSNIDNSTTMSEPKADVPVTPLMAPPLRRRGDGAKRGFFKRLFGIK